MERQDAGADPMSRGLTKRKVAPEHRVHCDGFKLRGGCVPWRAVADTTTDEIEVMLIEGINSPGKWSFPAGSLDPGEEVAVCAVRETEEESGVRGVRGCCLGMFQRESKKGKSGGSRSYFFALQVHSVINEHSSRWRDPDSAWESDGWRNRGWFTPAAARPKLKDGQEAVLDVFLGTPPEHLADANWRPSPAQRQAGNALRLLLVGKGVRATGVYQADARKLVGTGSAEGEAPKTDIIVLSAGAAMPESDASAGQQFAVAAAALWEADAVVIIAGAEADAHAHYMCGLSAAAGIPVLCFTDTEDSATVLASDRRMTVQGLCASAEEYGTTIRRFISTAS